MSSLKRAKWLGGLLICGSLALTTAKAARGRPFEALVPLAFLLVLLPCARYFGMLAGVLGSLLSALIFALYLYAPVGSLQIVNDTARSNLGLMAMGGIVLSYFMEAKLEFKE
jgi:K+-sensing histidine kinase KdpD